MARSFAWRLAALLAFFVAAPAGAQSWSPGPGHGPNGVPFIPTCSALWDYDGAGPLPPALVVGIDRWAVCLWTGSKFVPLGGAPSGGAVRSLAVYNGQLYAGGSFSSLGTDVVNNVARWDGVHWVPLGTGMTGAGNPGNPTGSVNSMVVLNGLLYIGGTFVPVSTGTWDSFAVWNGSTLTAGLSTQAPISQLITSGGLLYASTTAGVPGVYRYDTSTWTRFGTLADKSIRTLAVYNGDLVCGGEFTHFFTGESIVGVARWGGTQWVPMGAGVGPAGSKVTSLANYLGNLVAAGTFTTMDGAVVHNIASWNGSAWSDMAGGLTPFVNGADCVFALGLYNGELDALGDFITAGGGRDTCIVRWNGTKWLPMIAGINGRVRALLPAGTGFYAGGDFVFDWNGVSIGRGFASDGLLVDPLGTPPGVTDVGGPVSALAFHQFSHFGPADLIVGGTFAQAGGLNASNIAHFTYLSGWGPLGNGFNNTVTAIANLGTTLYAAGYFTASGAVPVPHVAKYGSTGWVDPGAGAFNIVYALGNANGKLIIGGAPGADGVSSWDGTTLTVLGVANAPVTALTTYNGDIIAAGVFSSIGGVPAAGIARRDATSGAWSAMGPGFSLGYPYALAVYDNSLYAGGTFQASGATPLGRIAKWNGASWSDPLGGLDGAVFALASAGTKLYVGGDFQQSNDHLGSPYLIAYHDGVLAVEPGLSPSGLVLGESWPNPAHERASIVFVLPAAGRARLVLHDVAGRDVRTLADGWFDAGEHTVAWDGRADDGLRCAAGVYFCRLDENGDARTRRMVVVN